MAVDTAVVVAVWPIPSCGGRLRQPPRGQGGMKYGSADEVRPKRVGFSAPNIQTVIGATTQQDSFPSPETSCVHPLISE